MSNNDDNKYRNITRAGVLYLAGAWLVVQTIMALTPVFDWPPIFGFGILFMLIPGLPIILLMTWVFDVTHQDPGWDKADAVRNANKESNKGFQSTVIILASLALLVMLLDIFLLVDSEQEEQRATVTEEDLE